MQTCFEIGQEKNILCQNNRRGGGVVRRIPGPFKG